MFQQFYQPHPALKGFVNNIMIHHVQLDADQTPRSFHIPPLPEHCLFFYVRDKSDSEDVATKKSGTLASSIIVGPNVSRHSILPGRDHLMIKAGFQPGGLYRLLGIPMTELLGYDAFTAVELLGTEINDVDDRLQEAGSYLEMKSIVEGFLLNQLAKLKPALPIDAILPLAIRHRGLLRIDQLASHSCLSIRQFERVFQQRIGLPPKHYSRLIRFAHAWIMKEHQPDVSWISVAYECGYFDQMHLIRDFHEFAGVNPSEIESELLQSPAKFFNRLYC